MKTQRKTKTAMKSETKKVPTWLRRKREVEALRLEREELETTLLFSEIKRVSSTSSREFVDANLNQLRAKTAALLARRHRQAAEDENEQLKRKLQLYLTQSEALRTTLATAASIPGALRVEINAHYKLRFSGASILGLLERRVDERVVEVEDAFRKMAMETSTPSQFVETKRDGGAVKLSLVELLPFESDASSSAMWAMIETGKFPDGDHSRVARLSENTFAVHSNVSLQLASGGSIGINGHSVIKRLYTAAGSGILTESCAEWTVSLPNSGTWTHVTRETGCFVIRQYCAQGCVLPGVSQSRSELCLGPSEFVGNTTQYRAMKEDLQKEIVVPSFRGLVASRHQFAENTLFDTIRMQRAQPEWL